MRTEDKVSSAVVDHVICTDCGYNLFGLNRDGRCPECGAAVADSVRGDGLAFANREWVRRICGGLTFLYAACLMTMGTVVFGILILSVVGLTGVFDAWFPLIRLVIRLAALAAPILAIVGVYKVTAPDPGASLSEGPTSRRRVARVTVVAMLGTIVVWIGAERLVLSANMSQDVGEVCIILAGALAGISVLVMILTLFGYLATLAHRIPNARIAKTGINTARSFAGFVVVVWLCSGTWPRSGVGSLEGLKRFIPMFGAISWLVVFIMGIKLMFLIGNYRRAILECLDEGRR